MRQTSLQAYNFLALEAIVVMLLYLHLVCRQLGHLFSYITPVL